MMEALQSGALHAVEYAAYAFIALLCLGGLALSALTLSGTWLVLLSALLAHLLPGHAIGWGLLMIFLGVCLAIEGLEWCASSWGVQKRGGSSAAGWAALGGGILGMLLGAFIPIPLIGSLIGMVAGGFAAAYAVERHRLKAHDRAMHIAWGTVTARVMVLFVKVAATLGMIVALIAALL